MPIRYPFPFASFSLRCLPPLHSCVCVGVYSVCEYVRRDIRISRMPCRAHPFPFPCLPHCQHSPASRSRAHCSPPATCPHVPCPGMPPDPPFVMCLSCLRCEINRAGQHRATVPVPASLRPVRVASPVWPHTRAVCTACDSSRALSSAVISHVPCPARLPPASLSSHTSHSPTYSHIATNTDIPTHVVMMCGSPIDAHCLDPAHVSAGHSAVAANSDIRDQAPDLWFQHFVVPVSSDRNKITPALISN